MACFNRPGRFRGVCLALLGLCLLTATSMARVRSEPPQSEVDKRQPRHQANQPVVALRTGRFSDSRPTGSGTFCH